MADVYMIHACPGRMWYVMDYLIPSMEAQGIRETEIEVWNDTEGKGNLFSCVESFKSSAKRPGATWHLQDDVIICRNFAERTREEHDGIVCGFACQNFGPNMQSKGKVPEIFMWYSFQCIRIPNETALEFTEWFDVASRQTKYVTQVADRKHDDWFFREFMNERHREDWVTNLSPNLVDHIDYMIGGTMINKDRRIQINRAKFFRDQDLIDDLEKKLKSR